MSDTSTGYARCSTDKQDLAAQRQALLGLGVPGSRIYLDHGLTGTSRDRPGLAQALAAVRCGDTLVVPKLDRLARSVPDARQIGDSLAARGVRLSLGGTVYDPADPMGKMFFNILATFAELEVDLPRMRTREGMAIARAKGKLKGKRPKLIPRQQARLIALHEDGEHTIAELAEILRRLPLRWHAQFLTEYRTALDAAREVRRWQQLSDLLHRWRLRATAYADPQFEASAQAARDARPEDLTPVPGWADRR
jgi:DNA invertase Pin-like site-specific DNA recombinase